MFFTAPVHPSGAVWRQIASATIPYFEIMRIYRAFLSHGCFYPHQSGLRPASFPQGKLFNLPRRVVLRAANLNIIAASGSYTIKSDGGPLAVDEGGKVSETSDPDENAK